MGCDERAPGKGRTQGRLRGSSPWENREAVSWEGKGHRKSHLGCVPGWRCLLNLSREDVL